MNHLSRWNTRHRIDSKQAALENFVRVERSGIRDYKNLRNKRCGYARGRFKVLLGAVIRGLEMHVEPVEYPRENLESA